ncbi:hypothetical protein REPUB_Repub04eG0139900 [Reevesia pubescens]
MNQLDADLVEEGEIVDDGSILYDDCIEEGIEGPCILLIKDDKQRIRKPFDMDNGYYYIRFNLRLDYDYVLTNGPWIIVDHYLIVRMWVSDFRSKDKTIDIVAAWIRFPRMPLEYYDSQILRRIGNEIGKFMKIDRTTSHML